MLVATEIVGTIGVVLLVTLPWILGGLEPSREDLTWSILLAFATGFIGIWAMVLTAFDVGWRDAASVTGSAAVDAAPGQVVELPGVPEGSSVGPETAIQDEDPADDVVPESRESPR
jgi:hypothetical protein